MTTFVGNQSTFAKALQELVELEYDAVEAYEAAINRLENAEYKQQLTFFKEDHLRHIKDISHLLKSHGEDAPDSPSALKQWLTKGKVVIGNLMGDHMILTAMKSNEIDTNTAYERLQEREDQWMDARSLITQGLEDERRHKRWLENHL